MTSLCNRRILLGVTGGIAAYKSAEIIRRLKDHLADVRVVMTPAAQEFITPLTLQALSGNPVHTGLLDPEAEAAMGHIELARWADLILVAPASADFMARLQAGMADDLLTTVFLASQAPKVLAPAMNQAMWRDPQTRANADSLAAKGMLLLGPAEGAQACGDVGPGRMLEPLDIVQAVSGLFSSNLLAGKRVVITAGPTREAIDPVRYISNHSSGKMGFALAQAAVDAGAAVTLITGPVTLATPDRVNRINVVSASDMHAASLDAAREADIFIASAAVADYRPATVAGQKIKKSEDEILLKLVRNPDIVAAISQLDNRPYTVGFAAETERVEEHARKKMHNKRLDMVIANDVSNTRIGFNSDNNAVTVMTRSATTAIPECNKQLLARELLRMISNDLPNRMTHTSN